MGGYWCDETGHFFCMYSIMSAHVYYDIYYMYLSLLEANQGSPSFSRVFRRDEENTQVRVRDRGPGKLLKRKYGLQRNKDETNHAPLFNAHSEAFIIRTSF